MSVRLSFGSRAGGSTDYQGGTPGHVSFFSRGPFDSIELLQKALKAEFDAAAQSSVPECTTAELSLSLNATLTLNRPSIGPYADGGEQDLPPEFKTTFTDEDGIVKSDPFPKVSAASVINVADGKQRQIVQRAASRGIIQAIEGADGFRYSFNNAWNAKDEEGSRFSYICQDSMQNKDRHANGFTRTLKHLKGEGERGPRKPTYDCKGSVSVKFSSTRQRVDVYYRHYAIHQTVAERKPPVRPPPRPRKEQKDMGGLRETLAQAESYANSALAMVGDGSPANDSPLAARSESSNIGRPLKRKRDIGPPALTPRDSNQGLSLMELLRQSETANAPPPRSEMPKPGKQSSAPAVRYELPSWQTPPPSLTQPSRNGAFPAPYPPPYNPNRNQGTPQQATPTPTSSNTTGLRPFRPAQIAGKNQGLYTTMKAITKPAVKDQYLIQTPQTYGTSAAPGYRDRGRARKSCVNCRRGKIKCDEGQPCGACQRSHRPDCTYDPSPAGQHSFSSQIQSTGSQQTQQQSQNYSQPQQQQNQNYSQSQQQNQSSRSSSSWGNISQASIPQQLSQWSNQDQSTTPSQSNYASQDLPWPSARKNSPDPWYPKR